MNPFQPPSDFANANSLANCGAGVTIVTDVRIDPDAPMLSFDIEGASRSYWVDEPGIRSLRAASDRYAPIIELTLDEGGRGQQTILLAPVDQRASGHWGIARMMRLGRFTGLDGGAAFQSFVSEASGLLADIHHDIRQHLAALSLAAHNGLGLLQAGRTEQARVKFDRILGQVATCEALLQSGTMACRSSVTGAEILPFAEAIQAALAPAREWMARQADATLVVSGLLPDGAVRAPAGSIEMLLGYILRQTAEAIRHCALRQINVVLDEGGYGYRAAVRHAGELSDSEIGCDGLALTLAHRVMDHLGGKMIEPNPAERRAGLVATLSFPRYEPPSNDDDQPALASSLR